MGRKEMKVQPDVSKPDLTSITDGRSAMSQAFQGLSKRPALGARDTWTPDPSSDVSDVDDRSCLKPVSRESTTDVRSTGTTAIPSEGSSTGDLDGAEEPSGKDDQRRSSIQVIVEETGKKSRYTVTTDDPDFRKFLRAGMQQEADKRTGKSKGRPRDLVFTRQFTTFDRQNPNSQSPFHGFFTLCKFWYAMATI
tara:strand:- start:33530 stop:34111 length:582 start_codon:yes stop_codon:yes gene_type:complete